MQLVLEKRAERSTIIALVSPVIAIGLTIVTMSILFVIIGKNPIAALNVYFITPLTDAYSLQELAVKAAPLVMIAIGLSLCYLANVWNIGAEGQFLVGAVGLHSKPAPGYRADEELPLRADVPDIGEITERQTDGDHHQRCGFHRKLLQ